VIPLGTPSRAMNATSLSRWGCRPQAYSSVHRWWHRSDASTVPSDPKPRSPHPEALHNADVGTFGTIFCAVIGGVMSVRLYPAENGISESFANRE
jgi:hypothetical protein